MVIYAVFLCDPQWKITKIRQCSLELGLKEGDFLSELVSEQLETGCKEESECVMTLNFFKQKQVLSAIIHSYREGHLIVLTCIHNNDEFLEFCKLYSTYKEWAKNHLQGLFHDEYYMIQKINNQLIDAQRSLMRSNRKLEQALKENHEMNRKLDEARKLAEHASFSKTNFLANMSHDIRTPLNAIVGLTELMQHNIDNPELLDGYISKMRSSSQYLLNLINDILDLSKIESGSMELKYEPMDIGAQIEQIITIVRPQISKKKQTLSVDGDSARYGYLMGDHVRFQQVLMNIFSNAIKYTPEGGHIRFTIQETEDKKARRIYRFMIEDNGIGMTQEFLEHIFDPFARAEASVREIQGTGLGMAITKSIVDAMKGTIHVSSFPGKGSCFEIQIPFEICDTKHPSDGVQNVQTQTDEDVKLSLEGRHFLCAEDNELNAEILKSMLEMEGADCRIYENGQLLTEAFEDVVPGQYDAILMDVQMPVMDGYEAARQIRKSRNPLGKRIPIIAMTANAFSEDVQNCLNAGMDAHIAKPLDFEKLKEIMKQLEQRDSKQSER